MMARTPRRYEEPEEPAPPPPEPIAEEAGEIEPTAAPAPATGTGNSTGTTSLAVTAVTGRIYVPSTVTGTGVPASTTITSGPQVGGAGTYITNHVTTLTNVALTFTPLPTVPIFPDFVPVIPPPLIGNPPPPAGTQNIPVVNGAVVGPAIAPAGVPPSTAGFTQPRFGTGSATAPTGAQLLPQFTTIFPNPPITVSNVWTVPTLAGGVWTTHLPAPIATTANIVIGGWGLPGPSGLGPGPPVEQNPPGAGKPFMAETMQSEDMTAPQPASDTWGEPPEPEPEENHRRGGRRRR